MIAAVVLAAGRSTRMGSSKMNLPWKDGRSIIEQVVTILKTGGASPIVVVTGYNREAIEESLSGLEVELVLNPNYATTEMLSSIKVGLQALVMLEVEAALITPGDTPLFQASTVVELIYAWQDGKSQVIAPSYQGRRGHPVLVGREEWGAIQELDTNRSLRDFLNDRGHTIGYVLVNDPGIYYDLDTLEEYNRAHSEGYNDE